MPAISLTQTPARAPLATSMPHLDGLGLRAPQPAPLVGLGLHPLPAPFGVEVHGIDLAVPLPEASVRVLRQALETHRLLVLRSQRLTPERQVAVTRWLGAPEAHPVPAYHLPGLPEVAVEYGGDLLPEAAECWHADLAYTARPGFVSALHAERVPEGGDGAATLFADQVEAYARLDPWLAHHVEYLDAEHDQGRLRGMAPVSDDHPRPDVRPIVHPVVRLDSTTGRRSLFVDGRTTVRLLGPPPEEGERLLRRLLAAATDPAVTYRHAWRPDDLVVWDNRTVLHRAERVVPGEGWRMHRTMVAGEPPRGPAAVAVPWLIAG